MNIWGGIVGLARKDKRRALFFVSFQQHQSRERVFLDEAMQKNVFCGFSFELGVLLWKISGEKTPRTRHYEKKLE